MLLYLFVIICVVCSLTDCVTWYPVCNYSCYCMLLFCSSLCWSLWLICGRKVCSGFKLGTYIYGCDIRCCTDLTTGDELYFHRHIRSCLCSSYPRATRSPSPCGTIFVDTWGISLLVALLEVLLLGISLWRAGGLGCEYVALLCGCLVFAVKENIVELNVWLCQIAN